MTNQIPDTDLKALRKKLGLTQKEFAEKYHLSFQGVLKWEQKKSKASEAAGFKAGTELKKAIN